LTPAGHATHPDPRWPPGLRYGSAPVLSSELPVGSQRDRLS
jgi:hypothetical protein